MSFHINVGTMNYNGLNYLQRSEMDKRRINRLAQVRQQSKEIAQQVRVRVQCEKENQLKKIQEIKNREMAEWKKRKQCDIQQEYDSCLSNFGAAHFAACETSCEEDDLNTLQREEYDLLAAQRGRCAMLQEQRKRDLEAVERIMKKKRNFQRSVSIQADLKDFQHDKKVMVPDQDETESTNVKVDTFANKSDLPKNSYSPKNFTSNYTDSSNNCESESSCTEIESDVEFNQISNLLKQKCFEKYNEDTSTNPHKIIELSDTSCEEIEPAPKLPSKQTKKSILKQTAPIEGTKSDKKRSEKERSTKLELKRSDNERVKYVDFGNHYTTSYLPENDLVAQSVKNSIRNAATEAKKYEVVGVANDEIFRQLSSIRSKKALEKEKTRRDYESLRIKLDGVSKQEKEAKENVKKGLKNFTVPQLRKQEQNRVNRMNQDVEKTLNRNIITCPPVEKPELQKPSEVNVSLTGSRYAHVSSNDGLIVNIAPKNEMKTPHDEINNIVKVERLKDLLERINHQKKLLLREIEKSEEIPGPDLEKVMQCLDSLEKEKTSMDFQHNKTQELEIIARELQLKEREKRYDERIKEIYKNQKNLETKKNKTKNSESNETSEDSLKAPPVEIVIKVHQPKSPRSVPRRKTIRCLDKLKEPGRAYPKTPKKKTKEKEAKSVIEVLKKVEPTKIQQHTQTSPLLSEVDQIPLLKKHQKPQQVHENLRKCDESSLSCSTTYQSLPERIYSSPPIGAELKRKPHHNLNPVLMHYITRLLGMNKNIGNQLNVSVSTISNPSSSTIYCSNNFESLPDVQFPSFDQKRLEKLQKFINENYSFLSEINETLNRSQLQEENEENFSKVDVIWRDVLSQKKVQKSPQSTKTSGYTISATKNKTTTAPVKPQMSKKVSHHSKSQMVPSKINSHTSQHPNHKQSILQKIKRSKNALSGNLDEASFEEKQQSLNIKSNPQTGGRQITNRDMINVTKHLESHMLNNFAEYTANCQKRIVDLAQMMEQVRQEKLKLIENSLSSGEFGHFTEYREIVVSSKANEAPTPSASDFKESPSQREDPASEEINNILQKQTRPFGVSKDSGISMLSRPVTSSDFRDSPDVRLNSEERENTFQPIIKDFPKFPKVKEVEGKSSETRKEVSLLIKDQEEKALKKLKPPLSINRFSPHIEKPHEAHELSTIVEVETPSTSKVNLLDKINELGMEGIDTFPGFEEYVKNVHETEDEPMTSSLPNLEDVNNALNDLRLKSFLVSEDYGIPEISRENFENESSKHSSIVDIIVELKRREIVDRSFVDLSEDESNTLPNTSSQFTKHGIRGSPKREPTQSRIRIRTPDIEVQIERDHVETTKNKHQAAKNTQRSEIPKPNDIQSGIQDIKEQQDVLSIDFEKMGMNWAASMLKRDGERRQDENSSTSTSVETGHSIDIEKEINKSTTCDRSSTSSSNGQPLNLREFLVRELNRRSRTDESNSEESSLCSQFMKSLLNVSNRNSSSNSKSEVATDCEKQRTSTPVQTKGSHHLSVQHTDKAVIFLGDSLSTLKASETSTRSEKSNYSEQHSEFPKNVN